MIMTTFEFSTHKPVHFGSDVVILTTASLFGEHGTGLIQLLLHTHIASVTWRREGLPYLPYTGSPTTSSPIYGADYFAYG